MAEPIAATRFRAAEATDQAEIATIHALGLMSGEAGFRDAPHDWASFTALYARPHGLALVVEGDGALLGWAGVSRVSAREVYAGVGEVSIYLHPDAQGRGIGRALLAELITQSEQAGFWTLTAVLFPENAASLALHRAQGFRVVGHRERIGQIRHGERAGQWRDTLLLERRSASVGVA